MRVIYVADKTEASYATVRSENVLINSMIADKIIIESNGQDLPCDSLLLRNGKVVAVLVQNTDSLAIVYKMCDEQEGENYLIDANLVKSIKKSDGSVTNLSIRAKPVPSQSIAEDNTGKPSDKFAKAVKRLGGLAFIPVVGWIFAILSFILGSVVLYKIKKYPAEYKGAHTAWTGITLGIIALVLGILIAALLFASMGML